MAKQPPTDPTVLAATTWQAVVEGWRLQAERDRVRSQQPATTNLRTPRRMAGGSYSAGPTVPRDATTGVPMP
jgi:hypothetical protein